MTTKRIGLVLSTAAVLALSATLSALWPKRLSAEQTLPDGTVISLSVLGIGPSVSYEGTLLERTLGRLVPSTGLKLGNLRLNPPQKISWGLPGRPDLVVRIQIVPRASSTAGSAANRLNSPWLPGPSAKTRPYRGYHLTVAGDDGMAYGLAELGDFHDYSSKVVVLAGMTVFPRDSNHFHFRLESSDGSKWTELASFLVRNPSPVKPEPLVAGKPPRFKLSPDLELEIGEVTQTVVKEGSLTSPLLGTVPFRVFHNGQIATNWGIADGTAKDALGNPAQPIGNSWGTTNDWTLGRVGRSISPSRPWRIHLDLAPWRDFPATNLHSIYVTLPLSGTFRTNVDGFAMEVDRDSSGLEIRMPTNQPGLWMKVLHVIDRTGRDLTFSMNGSWGSRQQYSYRTSLFPPSTGAQIKIVIAIVPTYGVDFVAQPGVTEAKMPGDGSLMSPGYINWDVSDEFPVRTFRSQPADSQGPWDGFNPPRPELVHPEQVWW